jgi:hypothetical protein
MEKKKALAQPVLNGCSKGVPTWPVTVMLTPPTPVPVAAQDLDLAKVVQDPKITKTNAEAAQENSVASANSGAPPQSLTVADQSTPSSTTPASTANQAAASGPQVSETSPECSQPESVQPVLNTVLEQSESVTPDAPQLDPRVLEQEFGSENNPTAASAT